MTNNDILRRLRYIFDFNDTRMIALFALAAHDVTRAEVSDWLKKEEDPTFQKCHDRHLALFLNGLIIARRGKRDGPQPAAEKRLNNNLILRKLKIALNLRDTDILEILSMTGQHLGKAELNAFFRNPDHRHYRDCKDQVLRNFLNGIQLKYRDET